MKWDMNLAAQKKGDTTLNDTRKALSVPGIFSENDVGLEVK